MFNGKSVLVTGGTGSFGRKFIGTILKGYKPRRVVVYSRGELANKATTAQVESGLAQRNPLLSAIAPLPQNFVASLQADLNGKASNTALSEGLASKQKKVRCVTPHRQKDM